MKIDHIGYAVKNVDRARKAFETLGFVFDEIIIDESRNIYIQFGSNDGYRIELVSPYNKNMSSPVDNYLSKVGPTPYHICYKSDRFEEDILHLEQNGYKVTIPPTEACAFGNKKVVFMMNLGLGLIEIVEQDEVQ